MKESGKGIGRAALALVVGGLSAPLFALPATLSLPAGRRPGLRPLTIDRAARQLQSSDAEGWELAALAQALVAQRMRYSRRNSLDPAWLAFDRGYGYCQQMAFALAALLRQLGFEARVVQALRNRFPDGEVGGHAWVLVTWNGESRHIDALHGVGASGELDFQPLSRITGMGPLFRLFAAWGATGVNAYRYYQTGKDR